MILFRINYVLLLTFYWYVDFTDIDAERVASQTFFIAFCGVQIHVDF